MWLTLKENQTRSTPWNDTFSKVKGSDFLLFISFIFDDDKSLWCTIDNKNRRRQRSETTNLHDNHHQKVGKDCLESLPSEGLMPSMNSFMQKIQILTV